MKRCLLSLIAVFCWSNVALAQLENGSILQDNLVGTDLVTGENIDVFELLDNNKTIAIHLFTSWSSSAWDFHQSSILQNLEIEFGAGATDQLRVIAVEIDELTMADDITNSNGATNTKGDWSADNGFSFVDDANWASVFNESNVPAIYIIRPNRAILNMRSPDVSNRLFDEDFWQRALGFAGLDNDIYMLGELTTSSYCAATQYQTTCRFLNLGSTNINTAGFELRFNGENPSPFEYTGQLSVFNSATVETQSTTIEETTELSVRPLSANGVDLPVAFSNFITGQAYFDFIEPSSFIVRVNTDYYPGETSGSLTSDNGLELLNFGPFEAGTEDQWGGGGPDANTSHDFIVDLPWPQSEINCLRLSVVDDGGDGFQFFSGENPPGIQFLSLDGDIIKDQFETKNFGSSMESEVGVAVVSSTKSLSDKDQFQLSPNPSNGIINMEWTSNNIEPKTLKIYNDLGSQVFASEQASIKSTSLDLSHLATGVYTLCVHSSHATTCKRLIISR